MASPFLASVAEAVARSQTERKVFVAFLADDSAASQRLDELFLSDEVANHVKSNFVAVRLVRGSVEAQQFDAQFVQFRGPNAAYPALCALHTTFDMQQLTVLPSDAEQLTAWLDRTSVAVSAQPGTPRIQPPVLPAGEGSASPSLTPTRDKLQEYREYARQRLAEANKEREQRRIQQEKEDELKRREQGKQLVEAKQTQEDIERKASIAKRKQEQATAEEHKRRVKEMIELDKANRRAEKEHAAYSLASSSSPAAAASPTKFAYVPSDSPKTGLAIRLLDGSIVRESFSSSDSLASVRRFIEQHVDGSTKFAIASVLPVHVYTTQEETKTLQELCLTPSASLVIKSRSGNPSAVSTNPNAFVLTKPSTWLLWLLSMLRFLWNAVYNFGYNAATTAAATPAAPSPLASSSSNKTESTSNIRTLRQRALDKKDDQPKGLFDNGNSTQYGGSSADEH